MSNTPPPTPPNVIPIGEGGTPVQMPGSTGGEGLFGTTGSHWPDPPPPPPTHVAPVSHPVAVPKPIPVHAHPVWHAIGLVLKTATVLGALGVGAAFGLPAIMQAINSIPTLNNTTPFVPATGDVYMHWSLCGPGSPGLRGTNGAPPACNFISGTARTNATPLGPDTQQFRDVCSQSVSQPDPNNTSINSAGTAQWNGVEGAWCSTDPTITVRPTGVAGTDWWDS